MKKAILIPVYNHGKACMSVVDSIAPFCREQNATIILVDDGNGAETKSCLSDIRASHGSLVELVVNEKNGGKGVAFRNGVFRAQELGVTHVLQMDADGQHDSSRCGFFFGRAEQNPGAMVCGYPEYDETAPSHRKNAHAFANAWCHIVTWRRGIKDSLCGFRVYPVEETCAFLRRGHVDSRMGFDIDILVKLIWRGVPFEFHPVRVTYPQDGISNFRAFRDNVRISWVFTKCCCGMIARSPLLLWRKIRGRH